MKIIGSGAEAILYLLEGKKVDENYFEYTVENIPGLKETLNFYCSQPKVVLKYRIPKSYRHPKIDENFRKIRTRREAKIVEKVNNLDIPSPKLLYVDEKYCIIALSYIEGKKLSELDLDPTLCKEVGYYVGVMHKHGIVHGDLTTSNFILNDKKVYVIDFGLSFFSRRVEDFAVDIHLFREALESKHWKNWEKCFEEFLEGYKKAFPEKYEDVTKKYEDIEQRGRYKKKEIVF